MAMTTKPTVLVAGITGMLGYKIAAAILEKGVMVVRALVRSGESADPMKQKKLDEMQSRGVVFVEGDLLKPSSLLNACTGVEAIISAVQGSEEIIVNGQLNLIQAAEMAGVKRMIPSDYSLDYRKLDWGDNYNLDMRRQVFNALEKSKLDYTLILNGCFMEVLFGSFLKIFDFRLGTVSYWGEGETLFDTTTTDDTAKYIAEAVVDPGMANNALEIVGSTLTMKQLITTYQRITGKTLIERSLGSIKDLKAWIEKTKAETSEPYAYLPEQYQYAMFSGKGKLDNIANNRYPHIKPTSISQYIQKNMMVQTPASRVT